MRDPLIVTGFIEWCARHFAEPAASNEDFQLNAKANNEAELTIDFEVLHWKPNSLMCLYIRIFVIIFISSDMWQNS